MDGSDPLYGAATVADGGSPARRLVVIGSGLAGLTAALEAARVSGNLEVLVLEKNPQVGGNSAKASSGINVINPQAGDTEEVYSKDTLLSGGGLSRAELVEQLVASSQDVLPFLSSLGLDLSTVVRLGGHSAPRTRSNPVGPNVGFALIQAVDRAVRTQPNVHIVTRGNVSSVAYSGGGRLAVSYTLRPDPAQNQQPEAVTVVADGVVFASGGFAASRDLLSRYRPDVADLATTNGPWATGDGVRLGTALGASLVHMDQVQVHPTGFVDPKVPDSGSKWLAPEKLRGCGAILVNSSGQRFVDELTTRDVITDAIMQLPDRVVWLLLGAEGASMFGEGTLGFYASRGLFSKVDGIAGAAQHMGVPEEVLLAEVRQYNTAAQAQSGQDKGQAAPEGTAPPGKFGKRYFPSLLDEGGSVWVARVTPVVHYCMGGMAIGPDARVLGADESPLPCVWAAGEAAGGLHGRNRLGGNSLAECVVFGRIAGAAAAKDLGECCGVSIASDAAEVVHARAAI